MLAQEQARIRQQYEERLRELESERQSVQEDKAQVGGRLGWVVSEDTCACGGRAVQWLACRALLRGQACLQAAGG